MRSFKFPILIDQENIHFSLAILISSIDYIRITLKRVEWGKEDYAQFLKSNNFIVYWLEDLLLNAIALFILNFLFFPYLLFDVS